MTPNLILLLMFGSLTLFMLTGLPIAFVLGGLSLLFTVTLWEPGAVIVLVLQIFDTMKSEALLAIPLFILMACILQRSGVIEDLYTAMEMWFGRVRGGLAIGTVIICVVMAAMTGVVGAAVTAMGILALPEMLRRGYRPQLALGTICASGTLGILIPPSVLTIVYAVTAQVSIGKMLIAGLVPGLLLASLYIAYIVLVGSVSYTHLDVYKRQQFPKQRVVARRVDQNMVPCIQQMTDDEVQRMVGTLGQQELTCVGLDAAFVEQPGQCLAQRQVAPGCAVAMVHPGKCLRLPATQVAAEFGAFHPTGRWPAIAHAHLVLLLQLFTQQRNHVHGFGHVAGGGLRARAAVLAHVVARPGPRLCVSACHQAVVGLDHRVA